MANNCIVTIATHEQQARQVLTWKDLHDLNYLYNSPFELALADNTAPFFADRVIRLVPKKRLVALGTWQGKAAIAKIFFEAHHAKRHLERDVAGIQKMQANKIPTPAILHQGKSTDDHVQVLLLEYIEHAQNLEEIWLARDDSDEIFHTLQHVIMEIATQHVLGMLQHDLHLKNFLLTDKVVYSLDGSEIELLPHRLPKKMSVSHLALFLSQLGVGVDRLQLRLFHYYAKLRGWILKKSDDMELLFTIKKWNEKRAEKFEKKIFRESTQFAQIKDFRNFAMYERSYATPDLLNFLNNPEAPFQNTDNKILKAGRSSTVIKVCFDGRHFVIKRYNLKNMLHRLRRAFRPTRATHSWNLAQKMQLFGIATAQPIGFIEKRFLGLRSTSYYVMEYIDGGHAGELLKQSLSEEEVLKLVNRITNLLKNLAKLKITHGDLKITNILVNRDHQPLLIDLDGAVLHGSLSGLNAAWRKEIKRFLHNFTDRPSLLQKFQEALGLKNKGKSHAGIASN